MKIATGIGQSFEIVKGIDQIEEIWERLKTSFGNVVILLNDKLSEVVINGPPVESQK